MIHAKVTLQFLHVVEEQVVTHIRLGLVQLVDNLGVFSSRYVVRPACETRV